MTQLIIHDTPALNVIKMRKLFTILVILTFHVSNVSAQQNTSAENKIWKQVHNVLSDFNYPKDSLLIYSLNFTLKIEKTANKLLPSRVVANDSLAYRLFPNYKKLADIDFSPILGTNTKLDVMIPVLIYGGSPEKMKHKDENGQPLINFNASVNAALALISNKKYDNSRSSYESPEFQKASKQSKIFRSAIIMEPYIVYIANIK
ncbi:hypothetical protein [Pedobacter sp. SL55]|uniref:hypothetical protein n=1 Tax=Pedobacter sp. SL55 TaxID=2995161 RepID=UPI0022711E82|nr:hypothetical protein [Pedobacter sp. SL55]WAC41209.1 hypothetical protein OVA16_02200 [Pedobacter sp. SL55]